MPRSDSWYGVHEWIEISDILGDALVSAHSRVMMTGGASRCVCQRLLPQCLQQCQGQDQTVRLDGWMVMSTLW